MNVNKLNALLIKWGFSFLLPSAGQAKTGADSSDSSIYHRFILEELALFLFFFYLHIIS